MKRIYETCRECRGRGQSGFCRVCGGSGQTYLDEQSGLRKPAQANYVEIDEGRWVLRYRDEDWSEQTTGLDLEWHERNGEDARKVAAQWLDVPESEVDIRE